MHARAIANLTVADIARNAGNARVDLLLVAEWSSAAPACSMSAAATANC